MSDKVVKSQFERVDEYNPASKFEDKYQEHWVHKQVVVRTGDGEDDWIIEEKPVMTEKINIFKQIQEEAINTDLKELLRQFALTGDDSVFNKRRGFFGDVSRIQEAMETGEKVVPPEAIKDCLPPELQKLSVDEIVKMSDEDIVKYFNEVRKQEAQKQEGQKQVEKVQGKEEKKNE